MKKLLKVFSTVLAMMLVLQPVACIAYVKDETIYTTYDSNGKVTNTSVVNHLSVENSEEIEDNTELTEILNLNGDETYALVGTTVKWQNLGKDIYYKGTTEKDLPIQTEIKYYLDGEEQNANEMVGKSGKVKIEMNFTNKLSNSVIINGKKETLYTPFVVTVGTMIKNDKNSNFEIDNGKAVDTGTRNVVVGLASPGLYESLGIDELKDLDQINIEFDTTDFKLSTMYIVATPKLLEESDLKIFDKVDEVVDNAKKLQENMNKIEDGANQLADGTKQIKESLQTSIDKMNNSSYKAIDDQVLNQIGTTAVSQAKLNDLQKSQITNGVSEKINAAIDENSIATQAAKSATIKAYMTATGSNESMATQTVGQLLSVSNNFANPEAAVKAMVQTMNIPQGADEATIQAAMQVATKTATEKVTSLKIVYDTAYNTAKGTASSIKSGLKSSMPNAVVEVAEATAKQTASATSKSVAIQVAKEFTGKTVESLQTLYNAIGTLESGVIDLSNGITEYNKQGINKLSDYADKLSEYSAKAEKLVDLSKEYAGFATDSAESTTFVGVVKAVK